jgi:glycosyltransferase involved in cell wall biosynthesis
MLPEKMNIAIIALRFLPFRGGMELLIHDLANELTSQGHSVTVFASRIPSHSSLSEYSINYNLVHFGMGFKGAYRLGFNKIYLLLAFAKLHKKKSFDILNSHSAYFSSSYAHFIKRFFKLPLVVTCHGHDIQKNQALGYGYRLNPAIDKIIQHNLKKSDRVIAISKSMYDEILTIVDESKIDLIPNGVHINTPIAISPLQGIRNKYGLYDQIIILSVGRNVPKKGFDIGLKIFSKILQEYSNIIYVHIGKNPESLINIAKELNINERFFTLGEQPHEIVKESYREVDIFFIPSIIESFGIVTIEAMAAGLPCVAADSPGNRDIITNGYNGLLFPVDDLEKASEILKLVINDLALRNRLGQNAIESVIENFTWPIIAKKYAKVFSNLVP